MHIWQPMVPTKFHLFWLRMRTVSYTRQEQRVSDSVPRLPYHDILRHNCYITAILHGKERRRVQVGSGVSPLQGRSKDSQKGRWGVGDRRETEKHYTGKSQPAIAGFEDREELGAGGLQEREADRGHNILRQPERNAAP